MMQPDMGSNPENLGFGEAKWCKGSIIFTRAIGLSQLVGFYLGRARLFLGTSHHTDRVLTMMGL